MDFEEMNKIIAEYCETVSYDKTRDWRKDPRTAEDPDDEPAAPVAKPKPRPVLNFQPKVTRK